MKGKGLSNKPLREDLVMQACLEAYGAVRHEGRLADRALDSVLRNRKHLYSNERRAVAERVYALLRKQRLVDFLVDKAFLEKGEVNTTERDVLRLATSRVLEGEAARAVSMSSGLGQEATKRLDDLPRFKQSLAKLPKEERFAIEASVPDFFAKKLLEQLGDEAQAAAEAMGVRAPLCGRVNLLKTTREALAQDLRREGVTVTETKLSPLGLILETRVNVYALEAFKAGLFEVQDEGSQLLGMLVDGPPRKVIDACAGAGGKTLQVAAQMKNKGELFALDVDARRLEDLKLRARRAGVHNVRIHAIAPEGEAAAASIAQWKDSAERVLVDAPCSGSGTFRRKPDARYRLDEATLLDHVRRQDELLERFSSLVKPGGRLIYGTCSVLREENEEVVARFLARHPEFSVMAPEKWLGDIGPQVTREGFLRLFPHRHGTDGFFGAVLERKRA